jgi:hypothetical protein
MPTPRHNPEIAPCAHSLKDTSSTFRQPVSRVIWIEAKPLTGLTINVAMAPDSVPPSCAGPLRQVRHRDSDVPHRRDSASSMRKMHTTSPLASTIQQLLQKRHPKRERHTWIHLDVAKMLIVSKLTYVDSEILNSLTGPDCKMTCVTSTHKGETR